MSIRLWTVVAGLAVALGAMGGELSLPPSLRAKVINLPKLEYRDATVRAILEDIAAKSRESDPAGVGVNLVVMMSDADANRRLTMSTGPATVERALKLLAAAAELYVRYEPNVIVVEKSKNVVGGAPARTP